jgi:hypothetical protein
LSAAGLAQEAGEPATEPPGELFDLRYQFQPGETIRWQVEHRATVKTTIRGTTQTAKTRSESVKVWKVSDVSPEGEITFVHSVDSVHMTNQVGTSAAVEYDSTKDETPPPGFEQAAQAVGIPLTVVRIDPRGKILSREEKRPQPSSEDTPITFPLPEKPVPIGHVWTDPHEVTVILSGGRSRKVQTRQRYELKSVAHGVATIAVDYQVLTPLSDPSIEAQLVQRLSSGTIKFDIDAGRLINQQRDVDKRILGISGEASSMHYLMRFTEELLDSEVEVAEQPQPAPTGKPTRLRR